LNTARAITEALAGIDVAYAIGGSVASAARGVGRTTFDVDIVARIATWQVDLLVSALGKDWYLDADTARQSILSGRCFNVIHMLSGDKFDIFPANEEFHASQLDRALMTPLEFEGETVDCPVATAEDILLAKLQWYRDGGEVSERQWTDILGILAVNPDLDFGYVRSWAARLRVERLLGRAIEEARS
jgi:hypothetical protein